MKPVVWVAIAGLAALVGCGSSGAGDGHSDGPGQGGQPSGGSGLAALVVTSPQWRDGSRLVPPIACTDSAHLGHSPSVAWTGAPPGTTTLAVTVLDPDAGDFVHWALLGVPPSTTSLPEGSSPGGALPAGARELTNGFGKPGYGGPCPPPGATHHYVLTVWALHRAVSTLDDIPGAALASGQLTATYRRG